VASLQGEEGVSIGIVTEHLHVTSTFITAQSHLLAQQGFLRKKENAADRRVSLLSLTPKNERLVDELVEPVRPINDMFFGILQKSDFDALSTIMEKLVDSKAQPGRRKPAHRRASRLQSRSRLTLRPGLGAPSVLHTCPAAFATLSNYTF
jgi:DNA-binding MarR family transcriptional regulator